MKRFLWMAFLILAAVLSGCAAPQTVSPTPAPTTAPPQEVSGNVVASATVEPARASNLSFVISAPVKEIAVKEGDVVKAGQNLVTLNSPDLEYGLSQAEAALRAAEFDYEYWIPPRFNRPPERRQLAQAVLVVAQKEYETAQANLTQAALTAPFDGTVIAINVQQGEFIQPGQAVITLADLNTLQIETTDLSERDIPKVKLGQSALVFVEALDAEFNGTVTSISPIADIVGGDVVYKVIVTLDEQPAGLLWGMNAEVEISTE